MPRPCYKSASLAANFLRGRVYLPQDAEDAALVGRCLAGDQGAFEALIERYKRPLFNVAVRMLGSREDAEDALQNALVRIYQNLAAYRPDHRFFIWIYRAVVNECLNGIRARRHGGDEPVRDRAGRGGPLDALEAHERRAAVQQALLALGPDLRTAVVLRHYAGLSYEEIGEAVGVPVKTVKSRLYTARQRLGQQLLQWGQGR
jgi:RNA polymerase sigma-70 factor (ECF subfamily)